MHTYRDRQTDHDRPTDRPTERDGDTERQTDRDTYSLFFMCITCTKRLHKLVTSRGMVCIHWVLQQVHADSTYMRTYMDFHIYVHTDVPKYGK